MSGANLDVKGESIDEERNQEESACKEKGCSEEKEVVKQVSSSSIPAPRNRGRFYFGEQAKRCTRCNGSAQRSAVQSGAHSGAYARVMSARGGVRVRWGALSVVGSSRRTSGSASPAGSPLAQSPRAVLRTSSSPDDTAAQSQRDPPAPASASCSRRSCGNSPHLPERAS